ncbi:PREDICTED: 39S ribosomal protein L28, mitochondrial-like, partial [Rhagoletis zephyria]|uniref:39S ribosomal protein L28, mitochondrial-like n=1 Tax=Rhagoletis zephyria TaxID=28612 RepID=UPI00081133D1
ERVPEVPIEVMYSKEADLGLLGGEGIVKGYVNSRKYFQADWPFSRPKYFFPELKKALRQTLALFDEHHCLDGYILKTPVQDLKSQLALQLCREMLLTLLIKKRTCRNEAHRSEIRKKYTDCVTMSPDEAEWFGFSTMDALT